MFARIGQRLDSWIDRFLFEMDAADRCRVLLRLIGVLSLLYGVCVHGAFRLAPGEIPDYISLADLARYADMYLAAGGIAWLLLILGRRRPDGSSPEWLTIASGLLLAGLVVGIGHWIGSLTSAVVLLPVVVVAVAVPFFGRRATWAAGGVLSAQAALILLESAGVLRYGPLGVNASFDRALETSNVALSLAWILGLSVAVYLFSHRIQVRLNETRERLAAEHEALRQEEARSQRLLENILPLKVIDDLKRSGSSPPEVFEEVTVFFSDLVGFTEQSSRIPPAELISELSTLFGRMDEMMAAQGCERIKTIGDAYLGVCGMPVRHPDHAARMVTAARRILDWLAERNRTAAHVWRMRIGIHTGPVVGGIVGHQRYLYDVFGDAINTASRMESSGEAMRINISQATWERIGETVPCDARGALSVKGKGDLPMYFVSGSTT